MAQINTDKTQKNICENQCKLYDGKNKTYPTDGTN